MKVSRNVEMLAARPSQNEEKMNDGEKTKDGDMKKLEGNYSWK